MRHRFTDTWAILLVGLAALLAACGRHDASPASMVSFQLALLADSSITAQGIPHDPETGALGVQTLRVWVSEASGDPVTFILDGDEYVADEHGDVEFVTLSADGGSMGAQVTLPGYGNPYRFVAHGFFDDPDVVDDAAVIAHADQYEKVVDGGTVWLEPRSVLGEARLRTRFPTNYVTPGATLDVMLVVLANGHDHLEVPIGDFMAEYTVSGGTIVSQSNRGLRLVVDDACEGSLLVTGSVWGAVMVDGEVVADAVAMNGGAGLEVPCPATLGGGLGLDKEGPTVTITGYDAMVLEVQGTADDNMGIVKVQIFDGPVLLASTDNLEATGSVAKVTFPGGNTFTATLTAPVARNLVAVAFDAAGNQGTSAETFDSKFVVVDANAEPGGIGTLGAPLRTIQEALARVASDGTVYVRNGAYSLQVPVEGYIDIERPVTILGESREGVVLDARGAPHAAYGMRIMANDVTIENLTLLGPDHVNTTGRGIFAQYSSGAPVPGQNIVIRNVTVDGARTHGISLTAMENVLLENVTVRNTAGGEGIGINIKSSQNVVVRNVVTAGNATVGINIESSSPSNNYPISNPLSISITDWVHDEFRPLALEVYGPYQASNISADGMQYAVACGVNTYYTDDEADALEMAELDPVQCSAPVAVSPADITGF
jgi:hypothetical protein